jgi:hypothetical protein
MSLRGDLCGPSTGMNLGRLNAFLQFLAERLSAPDYASAELMLHSTVNPSAARACHTAAERRERTDPPEAA